MFFRNNNIFQNTVISLKPFFFSSLAVQCPSPQHPANGRSVYSSTFYQSIVRFECLSGYELRGPSRAHCNSTGHWTNMQLVHCEPIHCPVLGSLPNLQALVTFKQQNNTNISSAYGSSISFSSTSSSPTSSSSTSSSSSFSSTGTLIKENQQKLINLN